MIKLCTSDMAKAYIGSSEVSKIYLGSELVYSKGSEVLPYDAEVEYLKGVDKAYIDTGIKASGNLHIKTYLVDYFIEANLGRWVFGGRNGYNNNAYGLYINSNSKKVDYTYYNTSISNDLYSSFPQSCWVEMQQGSLKINNTTYTFTKRTFTSSYNLILFGLNNGGNIVNGSGLKFGATYITNGSVALDLIPVRKNGIGYMYDKISGQLFGNANSQGNFIYGNDITV